MILNQIDEEAIIAELKAMSPEQLKNAPKSYWDLAKKRLMELSQQMPVATEEEIATIIENRKQLNEWRSS